MKNDCSRIGVWNLLNVGDHKGRPYNRNIKTWLIADQKPDFVGAALVAARITGHFLRFQTTLGRASRKQ